RCARVSISPTPRRSCASLPRCRNSVKRTGGPRRRCWRARPRPVRAKHRWTQPVPAASASPTREIDGSRVDSQGEEMAYLVAWPAPSGAWQVEGTAFIPGIPSTQKRVLLRAPDGAQAVVHFLVGSYHEVTQRSADPAAARVERAMRAGLE